MEHIHPSERNTEMLKSRFVTKIIAPLAVILLTLIWATTVYRVFLQIKLALIAPSYGCSSTVAMLQFVNDITYYEWLYGRASLADLRYLADTRLTTIRNEILSEN